MSPIFNLTFTKNKLYGVQVLLSHLGSISCNM